MDIYERSLKLHEQLRGKYEVRSLVEVKDKDALSVAYTPGVAQPLASLLRTENCCRNHVSYFRYVLRGVSQQGANSAAPRGQRAWGV